MMPVNQIDEVCRSNIIRGLDGIYSISMVTIQPKLFANGRVIKCQKVEKSV